jgi:hypothetical protein
MKNWKYREIEPGPPSSLLYRLSYPDHLSTLHVTFYLPTSPHWYSFLALFLNICVFICFVCSVISSLWPIFISSAWYLTKNGNYNCPHCGGFSLHAAAAFPFLTNILLSTLFPNALRMTDELSNPQQKLRGFSPRANYTDRAITVCRRSWCQLLRIEGATWSAWWIPTALFSDF